MTRVATCALTLLTALVTCKKEDPPPSYPAPAATYPSQVDPRWTSPPPPSAPAASPPGNAAAIGFFCASDLDIQCPFARCVNGHCGGCTAPSDCKAGAVCVATWVGFACLPGGSAAPSPAPTVASPTVSPPIVPPTATLPGPAAASSSADPTERARIRCTDRTNAYRARVGAPPVQRRTDLETCADSAALSDARARTVHGAFGQCRENAQNECPAWAGALDTVIDQCLDMMFAEGPGSGSAHGHYVNMTNRSYTQVGCGVSVGANGEVWIVQNFYR